MNKHPLAAKIAAFIDSLDHQPTFAEFMDFFKQDPLLVELMVISSFFIDYDPQAIVQDIFANNKDSERIEELMNRYEGFPELEELFIPKNAMAASLYKDNGDQERSRELIDWLFSKNPEALVQDLYSIRDLIFDGYINLEVPNCKVVKNQSISPYLMESITEQKTKSLQDDENKLNYENFYFYRLNSFSGLIDPTTVDETLQKYQEENQLSLIPITHFSIFLSGEFYPLGIGFRVNLRGLDNLFHGLKVKVKVKTSLKEIAQAIGTNLLKDEVANAVSDYLVDKIPFAREIKVGKALLNAIVNSSMEMTDISSLLKELQDHQSEIVKLNLSVKDYYINHYLTGEFKKFFIEHDIEYVHEEMKNIYERIYASFIQSVNNLLTPEHEQRFLPGLANQLDDETKKFLAVCQLLSDSAYKTNLQISRHVF